MRRPMLKASNSFIFLKSPNRYCRNTPLTPVPPPSLSHHMPNLNMLQFPPLWFVDAVILHIGLFTIQLRICNYLISPLSPHHLHAHTYAFASSVHRTRRQDSQRRHVDRTARHGKDVISEGDGRRSGCPLYHCVRVWVSGDVRRRWTVESAGYVRHSQKGDFMTGRFTDWLIDRLDDKTNERSNKITNYWTNDGWMS